MNHEWYYSSGDTRFGPVTEERLKELAISGELKPSDLIWHDGMPDWSEARTIPGLFPDRGSPKTPRAQDREEEQRDEPRRPRRRKPEYDDEYDDDTPRMSRRRVLQDDPAYDDDRDDFDDYRSGPRRSRLAKPSSVTACGIMLLIGGILGLLAMLGAAASSVGVCCFWPGIYFELVVCILMIVRATNMMNADDLGPPKGLAICQICFILNVDVLNTVLGIVILVMLSGDEAVRYYRRKGF